MSTTALHQITRAAAQKVTAAFDSMPESLFGGALAKAEFVIHNVENGDIGPALETFKFYINPHTIHIDKEIDFKEEEVTHGTTRLRYGSTKPVCLNLGELWFDTYDTRESVRKKYIDTLEKLLDYKKDTHVLNVVKFVWGEFTMLSDVDIDYVFLPSKLSVDYTLFLPSGMPCRAKVSMCLRQFMTAKKEASIRPKESPDHARIYTVKRGDTLQSIARFAYDSPTEWRRIANSNKLDDPMVLRPGTQLMLPPILK